MQCFRSSIEYQFLTTIARPQILAFSLETFTIFVATQVLTQLATAQRVVPLNSLDVDPEQAEKAARGLFGKKNHDSMIDFLLKNFEFEVSSFCVPSFLGIALKVVAVSLVRNLPPVLRDGVAELCRCHIATSSICTAKVQRFVHEWNVLPPDCDMWNAHVHECHDHHLRRICQSTQTAAAIELQISAGSSEVRTFERGDSHPWVPHARVCNHGRCEPRI